MSYAVNSVYYCALLDEIYEEPFGGEEVYLMR
jgi:hypothetical protein